MAGPLSRAFSGVSLATKITAVILTVITLGLVVAGVGTASVLRDTLINDLDAELESTLAAASRIVKAEEGEATQCSISGQQVPNTYYLALVRGDGTVMCDNTQAGPQWPELSGVTTAFIGAESGAFTVASQDGRYQWRMVGMPIAVAGNPGSGTPTEYVTLALGVSLTSVDRTVVAFTLIFSAFGLIVLLLGAALTRILVVSALRGMRRTASTAERFADGDYTQRLDETDPRTEIGRLNLSLNAMLARVDRAIEERDASVQQMRRFVGDASHELRTPLVSVRGYAELYRMGALSEPEHVGQAMERIESEAKRMASLVEDLLTLARLDEKRPIQQVPIDLVPLANDAVSDARVANPDRAFTVVPLTQSGVQPAQPPAEPQFGHVPNPFATPQQPVFTPPPVNRPAVVLGDENHMRQVIANIIGNAVRYTPEGTPIEVAVGVDEIENVAEVHIIDHGEGVPEQLRDKIFQRFYRADSSRARETGGSGLGLAIVQGIVDAHHGSVDVVETPGGGATFRIQIPIAPDEAIFELADSLRPDQAEALRLRLIEEARD